MNSSSLTQQQPLPQPSGLPEPLPHLIRYLQSTVGRDKLNRFVAYGSKYVIWHMARHDYAKESIARWKSVSKSVGVSRKLFRILRPLEYLQAIALSPAYTDEFMKYSNIIKNAALFGWLYYDMLEWLHSVDAYRLSDADGVKHMGARFWFIGLLLGVLQGVYKMRKVQAKLVKLEGSDDKKQLAALQKERASNALSVVKNGLDLIIPSSRLGWLPVEDGIVGLAGVTTTIIGAYEQWKKTAKK